MNIYGHHQKGSITCMCNIILKILIGLIFISHFIALIYTNEEAS